MQKSADRFGRKILIVETPDIFDTTQFNRKIQEEISKSISITLPGPHAFILVVSIGRFTEEEQKIVQYYENAFGENIFQYFIVLFTRKDDLDEEGKSLLDHIQTVPLYLRILISKCGGRVIAFNNRLKGDESNEQVRELLTMISKNVEKNNGECFKNKMYEEAEKLLQKREAEIRKKAQMERDKEIQAIKNQIMKTYLNEKEKQEREMAEEYEKLKKARNDVVREEVGEENRGNVGNIWTNIKLVLPDVFNSYS